LRVAVGYPDAEAEREILSIRRDAARTTSPCPCSSRAPSSWPCSARSRTSS
jgi:hypothetical protein